MARDQPQRFLIDAHHIGAKATGNETWALEVARAVRAQAASEEPSDCVVVAVSTPQGHEEFDGVDTVALSHQSIVRLAWDLPRIAKRMHASALLVQYTAPPRLSVPTVVAIHDLAFWHPASSEWLPRTARARMRTTIRRTAEQAAVILALSHHTANDLEAFWDVDPSRIRVVYPSVGGKRQALLRRVDRRPPTEGPHRVLIVGNVLPRKNIQTVVTAVGELRAGGLDVVLDVVGQVPPAGRAIAEEILHLGGDWSKISGYVSEGELVDYYGRASVFCCPSLYEGFGLTVLEAMVAGVPAVVSNATALPEAAGTGAILVDPLDVSAWASAICEVVTDSQRADLLVAAGRRNAEQFSWSRAGAEVLAALRTAADR